MEITQRNTFLTRLNKYKYLILVPIALLAIWGLAAWGYNLYITNKSNQNSLLFNDIQEKLTQGETNKAQELLTRLSKEGTNGYQLLSYLQQASLHIRNKDFIKAQETLKHIHSLNVPQYYMELADYMIFSIRLDHDKDLAALIVDLNNATTSKNSFYASNLELLAIAQYITKDYNNASLTLDKIINDNNIPNGIKERAKALQSVVLAYVK